MLMPGEIGALAKGMRADLIILNVNSPLWQPLRNVTNQVVFYENGSSVDSVIVEGKILLKHGHIPQKVFESKR